MRSLLEASQNAPALGVVLGATRPLELAGLRLLWSQRPTRPWDKLGEVRTVAADITNEAEVGQVFEGISRVDHVIIAAGTIVNGRIVNRAFDIKQPDPQNPKHMIPLTKGKILLEAEGSEIWFRNIKIKPLKAKQNGSPK